MVWERPRTHAPWGFPKRQRRIAQGKTLEGETSSRAESVGDPPSRSREGFGLGLEIQEPSAPLRVGERDGGGGETPTDIRTHTRTKA